MKPFLFSIPSLAYVLILAGLPFGFSSAQTTGSAIAVFNNQVATFTYPSTPDRVTGLIFIPLTKGLTVLGVSSTGIVALRDSQNYYRWRAGEFTTLAPYSEEDYWNPATETLYGDTRTRTFSNTGLTIGHDGTIAITDDHWTTQESESTFAYQEVVNQTLKIWPANGDPPVVAGTPSITDRGYFTDNFPPDLQTFTTNQHLQIAHADGGVVWCLVYSGTKSFDYADSGYPNLTGLRLRQSLVRIAPDGTATTVRSFDGNTVNFRGVSATGVPIGSLTDANDDWKYFAGGVTVDYDPMAISRSGQILGYKDGQTWIYRSGQPPKATPADGFGFHWDDQDRLIGYSYTDYQPALFVETGPGGAWQAMAYTRLDLPAGWSSSLMVPPGSAGPQAGQATNTRQETYPFLAVPAGLAVDANRDGTIKFSSEDASDTTSAAKPFRFWLNDDDDSGDMGGDDIPGKTTGANYADGVVNGTRDLVDFFPVFLDLKQLLTVLPPSASVKYKLKQADSALNFVYTNLTRDHALDYQTQLPASGFGDTLDKAPGVAITHQITAEGVDLTQYCPSFLTGIRDSGWGVILIEGRATTTAPLVLSVEKAGTVITEVKLELRISNVEDMFRHVDMTQVPKKYDGSTYTLPAPVQATHTGDPGEAWPDSQTNGKYFVFLHGFNVDGQRARGWDSEVFKRLHVLGSKARFVGVSWHGATGIRLGGSYTDYHAAVFNAFQTGDGLAGALSFTGSADVTVAAHSLGNIVASQAIQSGGLAANRYYMINCAVPIEAYDLPNVPDTQVHRMTESKWKSGAPGNRSTYAANWHQFFDATPSTPSDHRAGLKWKNRFREIFQTTVVYDFFSPGDDVVEDPEWDSPSILGLIFTQGFNFSRGAWVTQEFAKGANFVESGAVLTMVRVQGGWGQSVDYWPSGPFIRSPDQAREPYFGYFLEHDLFAVDPARASAKASQRLVPYDLLARGIPALSFAVAVHPLARLNNLENASLSRNFDMEAQGRDSGVWPTEDHTADGTSAGRWLHSDFKNVALPYVHKMYGEMINRGALK